jgi:hypothetical protein
MARRRSHPPCKELTAVTANSYLAYLDKEMAIMGILSTFCVAVIALVVDRIGSSELGKYTLFRTARDYYYPFVTSGSVWLLISAGLFYSQRSHLAWIYGQLSLSIESSGVTGATTEYWLREGDSWTAWIRYRAAFACIWLGFLGYGLAFFGAATHGGVPHYWFWLPPIIVWTIEIPHFAILWQHADSDTPVRDFLMAFAAAIRASCLKAPGWPNQR